MTSRKMKNPEKLIYESTALKLLEISREKFKKLRLKPTKEVPNPYYRSGPPSRLYDRVKIEKLIDDPRVVSLRPKPRRQKLAGAKALVRWVTDSRR